MNINFKRIFSPEVLDLLIFFSYFIFMHRVFKIADNEGFSKFPKEFYLRKIDSIYYLFFFTQYAFYFRTKLMLRVFIIFHMFISIALKIYEYIFSDFHYDF